MYDYFNLDRLAAAAAAAAAAEAAAEAAAANQINQAAAAAVAAAAAAAAAANQINQAAAEAAAVQGGVDLLGGTIEFDPDRATWDSQNLADVAGTQAVKGAISEEVGILYWDFAGNEFKPAGAGLLDFSVNVLGSDALGSGWSEDTMLQAFGSVSSTTTVKTTGTANNGGISNTEYSGLALFDALKSLYGCDPPILIWASVNDASLTTIYGDLDAYYGEYAETREDTQSLSTWAASGMPGVSRSVIWTLGNLVSTSNTTDVSYAAIDAGSKVYTTGHSEGRSGYKDGELAYLSGLAGYMNLSVDEAYGASAAFVAAQVDSLIDQMLVPDVGNQIVNRTVDQGILKKT